MTSADPFEKLAICVAEGREDEVSQLANQIIRQDVDLGLAIDKGLAQGILIVGERWTRGEVFITEVILAANAFRVGLGVLEPELRKRHEQVKTRRRFLIGTVRGDIHDIGKNIVGAMVVTAGFDVRDLGNDVPTEKFVQEVREFEPEILGLSSLLTTSMPEQRNVIEALKQAKLRDFVRVMVGGATITNGWAQEIGADAHGVDALDAVQKAKAFVGRLGVHEA